MAKNFMESIGNNIKRIRKQLGLTQEELAMHVGVTPQAVSRWENGTGMPDISLVVPLAKTLRVSTDSLFGINEEKYDSQIYINLKRNIEKIEADAESNEEAGRRDIEPARVRYTSWEQNNKRGIHWIPLKK